MLNKHSCVSASVVGLHMSSRQQVTPFENNGGRRTYLRVDRRADVLESSSFSMRMTKPQGYSGADVPRLGGRLVTCIQHVQALSGSSSLQTTP